VNPGALSEERKTKKAHKNRESEREYRGLKIGRAFMTLWVPHPTVGNFISPRSRVSRRADRPESGKNGDNCQILIV
jgi:hypothetical protein